MRADRGPGLGPLSLSHAPTLAPPRTPSVHRYVEYQRKQRMVLRSHKDALLAMANFW